MKAYALVVINMLFIMFCSLLLKFTRDWKYRARSYAAENPVGLVVHATNIMYKEGERAQIGHVECLNLGQLTPF